MRTHPAEASSTERRDLRQATPTTRDRNNLLKCPSCNDATLLISSRENIEIDYCPQCRGVWLDRGELDKIVERSDNQSRTTRDQSLAATDRRSHDRDDDWDDEDNRSGQPGKKRKRRSFLADMFEFGD